jgi:hypothetical protein
MWLWRGEKGTMPKLSRLIGHGIARLWLGVVGKGGMLAGEYRGSQDGEQEAGERTEGRQIKLLRIDPLPILPTMLCLLHPPHVTPRRSDTNHCW